jgi:hypothetical protein
VTIFRGDHSYLELFRVRLNNPLDPQYLRIGAAVLVRVRSADLHLVQRDGPLDLQYLRIGAAA